MIRLTCWAVSKEGGGSLLRQRLDKVHVMLHRCPVYIMYINTFDSHYAQHMSTTVKGSHYRALNLIIHFKDLNTCFQAYSY